MDSSLILTIFLGSLAASALNIGKGIQKLKVHVLLKGFGVFSAENRRDFSIWLLGVFLALSSTAFYSLSMKVSDKPSTVSSLVGVGLIALVVFARFVLKEKVGLREIAGATLIIAGTTILTAYDANINAPEGFILKELLKYTGFALIIYLALIPYTLLTGKMHGLIFGSLAGIFIGIGLFIADVALVESGGSLLGQFKNPYPYIAFLAAVGAFSVTQLAFFRGRAVVVVPCINSFAILIPLYLEFFIYNIRLYSIQYVGIITVVIGVVILSSAASGGMEILLTPVEK